MLRAEYSSPFFSALKGRSVSRAPQPGSPLLAPITTPCTLPRTPAHTPRAPTADTRTLSNLTVPCFQPPGRRYAPVESHTPTRERTHLRVKRLAGDAVVRGRGVAGAGEGQGRGPRLAPGVPEHELGAWVTTRSGEHLLQHGREARKGRSAGEPGEPPDAQKSLRVTRAVGGRSDANDRRKTGGVRASGGVCPVSIASGSCRTSSPGSSSPSRHRAPTQHNQQLPSLFPFRKALVEER